MMLDAICVAKPTMLPLCNISTLSLAKVEKVVNPPQSPVVSNRNHGLLLAPIRWKSAFITPNVKHPTRFIVSVPHGNPSVQHPRISIEIEYLSEPPKKLPKPTINIDFIIIVQKYKYSAHFPDIWYISFILN